MCSFQFFFFPSFLHLLFHFSLTALRVARLLREYGKTSFPICNFPSYNKMQRQHSINHPRIWFIYSYGDSYNKAYIETQNKKLLFFARRKKEEKYMQTLTHTQLESAKHINWRIRCVIHYM